MVSCSALQTGPCRIHRLLPPPLHTTIKRAGTEHLIQHVRGAQRGCTQIRSTKRPRRHRTCMLATESLLTCMQLRMRLEKQGITSWAFHQTGCGRGGWSELRHAESCYTRSYRLLDQARFRETEIAALEFDYEFRGITECLQARPRTVAAAGYKP
jgi:hypothetical protein